MRSSMVELVAAVTKSTGCTKSAKDLVRACASQRPRHSAISICGVPRVQRGDTALSQRWVGPLLSGAFFFFWSLKGGRCLAPAALSVWY